MIPLNRFNCFLKSSLLKNAFCVGTCPPVSRSTSNSSILCMIPSFRSSHISKEFTLNPVIRKASLWQDRILSFRSCSLGDALKTSTFELSFQYSFILSVNPFSRSKYDGYRFPSTLYEPPKELVNMATSVFPPHLPVFRYPRAEKCCAFSPCCFAHHPDLKNIISALVKIVNKRKTKLPENLVDVTMMRDKVTGEFCASEPQRRWQNPNCPWNMYGNAA